ncbi:MAG: hypothetical protein FJW23_02815 [Acidimicrobiia bacterium]|nr:hypothetical protein [Acidimicrobiia bacterium]
MSQSEAAASAGHLTGAGDLQPWVIEPIQTGFIAAVREFWSYRRLLMFFARKIVVERYKKTTLGGFWLIARPALPLVLNVIIFGAILGVASDGLPYAMFFLVGASAWMIFQRGLLRVTLSVDSQAGLAKKLYFPRLILPFAGIAPAIVDFLVYILLMIVLALIYLVKDGHWYLLFGPRLLLALYATFIIMLMTIGVGLITTVYQVRHAEVRFVIGHFTGFWMFLTPVVYPMSQIPGSMHWAVYMNPLSAPVETFRWAILGVGTLPVIPLVLSSVGIVLFTVVSAVFFNRSQGSTVDEL